MRKRQIKANLHETTILALHDQGLTNPEIAKRTGRGVRYVRHLLERARIRRNAEAQIDPGSLSLSAQQKLQLCLKQQLRKQEQEYHARIEAAVRRYLDIESERRQKEQNEAKRVMEARHGLMNRATYKKILVCLHPDWVTDAKQKSRYEEAFREFNKLEKLLLSEKDSPTQFMPIPRTAAEWEELKRKATQARRAKRESATTLGRR